MMGIVIFIKTIDGAANEFVAILTPSFILLHLPHTRQF